MGSGKGGGGGLYAYNSVITIKITAKRILEGLEVEGGGEGRGKTVPNIILTSIHCH